MRIREKDAKKRQQAGGQEGTYRRKPTPVKRYAGDLLAPSYLQSLRDRQMGTGTSLSSLGTTNHTMIDLDYDTGSTAPLTATTPVVRVWAASRKEDTVSTDKSATVSYIE